MAKGTEPHPHLDEAFFLRHHLWTTLAAPFFSSTRRHHFWRMMALSKRMSIKASLWKAPLGKSSQRCRHRRNSSALVSSSSGNGIRLG